MSLKNLQRDDFDGLGKLTRDHGVIDLEEIVRQLMQRTGPTLQKLVDGSAAAVLAEKSFHATQTRTLIVTKAVFVPDAALTANDTNFATIRVRKRKADGSDGGIVAEQTTEVTGSGGSGDFVAFVAVDLPLPTGDPTLAAGESLTLEILKTGSGVVVPAGHLRVFHE